MKFTLTFRFFRSIRFECPCPKSEAFPKSFRGTFIQEFTNLVVPTGTKLNFNIVNTGTIEIVKTLET